MNWEEITKSIDCAEQCEHKFAWDDAACITIVIGNLDKWEGSQLDVLADCQHALMLLSPNANNLSMKMFFKNICIISSTIVEELRPNETFFFKIYFFLAALGLPCCVRTFSSCCSPVAVHGLLAMAAFVAEHGFQ